MDLFTFFIIAFYATLVGLFVWASVTRPSATDSPVDQPPSEDETPRTPRLNSYSTIRSRRLLSFRFDD
jgi:hypothetical protein